MDVDIIDAPDIQNDDGYAADAMITDTPEQTDGMDEDVTSLAEGSRESVRKLNFRST